MSACQLYSHLHQGMGGSTSFQARFSVEILPPVETSRRLKILNVQGKQLVKMNVYSSEIESSQI